MCLRWHVPQQLGHMIASVKCASPERAGLLGAPMWSCVGWARLAPWGPRESFSFAKEEILFCSFCSLFFHWSPALPWRGECSPESAELGSLHGGLQLTSTLAPIGQGDRLAKTATPNLLLQPRCKFRLAFPCTDFCQFDFFNSGAVCWRYLYVSFFFLVVISIQIKVGHFGDKFLCRCQLLAYIQRDITLQSILDGFSSGAVECKVVQLIIIFPRIVFGSEYWNSTISRWMLNCLFTLIICLCIGM